MSRNTRHFDSLLYKLIDSSPLAAHIRGTKIAGLYDRRCLGSRLIKCCFRSLPLAKKLNLQDLRGGANLPADSERIS